MMGMAAYFLHWSPAEFFASTPHEFWAAYEIIEQANPPAKED